MDNIITASQALNQSKQTIEELGFPLKIIFNSGSEIEAFANAMIEKKQQAYPAGFRFKCWKSHSNLYLYDWEIKKLRESDFPITITFNNHSDISKFAYGIVGEYVPVNVNNEFDVNAWWKLKVKEARKQRVMKFKKNSKWAILSFSIVAAVTALILIIPSTKSEGNEAQEKYNTVSSAPTIIGTFHRVEDGTHFIYKFEADGTFQEVLDTPMGVLKGSGTYIIKEGEVYLKGVNPLYGTNGEMLIPLRDIKLSRD